MELENSLPEDDDAAEASRKMQQYYDCKEVVFTSVPEMSKRHRTGYLVWLKDFGIWTASKLGLNTFVSLFTGWPIYSIVSISECSKCPKLHSSLPPLPAKVSEAFLEVKTLRESVKKVDDLGKKVDDLGKKVDDLGKKVDDLGKKVDDLGKNVDDLCNNSKVSTDAALDSSWLQAVHSRKPTGPDGLPKKGSEKISIAIAPNVPHPTSNIDFSLAGAPLESVGSNEEPKRTTPRYTVYWG